MSGDPVWLERFERQRACRDVCARASAMSRRLENRHALLTGAAGGIGLA